MKKKIIIILIILAVVLAISIVGAYFLIKKSLEEKRNYEISEIVDYKYFVAKEGEYYGVIDRTGTKIVDTKYNDVKIPNPEKDVFICYTDKKTEVLNSMSEQLLLEYENVEPLRLKNISSNLMYEKTVLKYNENGKFGIINLEGKKLTKAIYDEIDTLQFKEGELIVKIDNKYGVININGATLVKINYDKIEADKYYREDTGYKNDGYIVSNTTEEGYRYGYVNIKGKEIIEVAYNELYRLQDIQNNNDAYIICAKNGKYGLFKNGEKIIENDYQELIYSENNNTIIAKKGKNHGAISLTGKKLLPIEYEKIDTIGDYFYASISENKTEVFDKEGKKANIDINVGILNTENEKFKIHIETIDNRTLYSIYENEKKITKNEYSYAQLLFDDYFIVSNMNGKLGIIDSNENIKVDFNYSTIQEIGNDRLVETISNETNITEIYTSKIDKIEELRDGKIEIKKDYIKLYNDEEVKYITKEGNVLSNIEIFRNNKIFATKNENKWGFIDASEKIIVDYIYDKATEINEYGFAGINSNGKWGAINSEGKVIVKPKYEIEDEPSFIGEYYRVIYGNDEVYYTK